MTLTVTGLSRRFGDKWVLRDASLRAETGKILGLFGPNGSGKTTLLRLIAGHEKCTSGTILDGDRDVTQLSYTERRFRLQPDSRRSFWQRLFGNGSHDGFASGEGRTAELSKAIDEAHKVLLIDGPFCGMDVEAREEFFTKLRLAAEKPLAIVIATNDYDDVLEACDEAAVLLGGEIKQTGTPQDVYENPNTVAVASIVGRNNIFYGRRLTSSKADLPEFQTLIGEHRLFTRKADVGILGAINKDAALAIRPENIVISFGASFPEDNLLKAVVTAIRPRGATTAVELDSNGLKLEALVLRIVGLGVGDECMIGLPPDRIQVLKH